MKDPSTGQVSFQQTFAASEVRSYEVVSKWYVDDLGELEAQIFQ